jgi:hypothetical protein
MVAVMEGTGECLQVEVGNVVDATCEERGRQSGPLSRNP